MDNLTHGLVGAALARTGLDRLTPLATTTLVVAANAPDVDLLSFAEGEYAALAFRRGLTHGLPAMAVLPFAVTGAILGWDRLVRRRRTPDAEPVRPRAILLLSVIGLLTHPALDWMNTYGMRWWLP
ncbi:MAG TPA: metal-dependent hydrolase, partial [Longimicrobiales bacterium]|nr:metal-dependent hydrolase [Longimicrobiales bacterium]